MIYKEIEGVLVMFYLDDWRDGARRGFGWKRLTGDPCSSFVTESAWPMWSVPLLHTCLSVSILSDSIDSGGPMVSPGGDLVLGFSRSGLGK